MLRTIFSRGCPFFSYIAISMNGNSVSIIRIAATVVLIKVLHRKNRGTATAAPEPKQMSCRFVRLNITFVLTVLKSLGTGT